MRRLFSGSTVRRNLALQPNSVMHEYEVRPRKDHRGVDLISDALRALRLTAQCD
jgi:hypothetical protein